MQRWGLLAVAVALLVWPLFTPTVAHFYGALAAIYALVALSLVILVGWTGQISLCHAAFLGFGVYIGQKLLSNSVPVPLAILIVAAFGAVVSLALGIPSLRLRGVYLTIVTLAFGVACQNYFFQLSIVRGYNATVVPRPSFLGLSLHTDRDIYYLVLVVLGLAAALAYNLRRTDPGRALFAVRDSEEAAQSMAIRIAPYKIGAFAFSAALATVAGLFYGMLYQATPGPEQFGVLQSLFLLALPVVGGLESLFGVIVGGAFLSTLQPLVNEFRIQRIYLVAAISLIIVLWSGWDGVTGMASAFARSVRDAVAPKSDTRYGSFVPPELQSTRREGRARMVVRAKKAPVDGTLVRAKVTRPAESPGAGPS